MMKVFVYWNRKDKDCKKIFHFMSDNDQDSVISVLKSNSDFSIVHPWQFYSDRENIINIILQNDLIIFLTHGCDDSILKCRNNPVRSIDDYILLNKENAIVLKGKKVIALCCSSAKTLGRYCVSDEIGCNTYIGFESDIVYDNGKALKSRHVIYEAYKKAFKNAIDYLFVKKCTGEQFKTRLLIEMRKQAVNAVMNARDNSINSMYINTIGGLVALGDVSSKLVY